VHEETSSEVNEISELSEMGHRRKRRGTGAAVTLAAGATLELGGLRSPGARAYLAVAGGIEVPVVLGARATALGAVFGGLDGRALRSGDRLRAGAPAGRVRAPARWPGRARPGSGDPAEPIRVLAGPHADLVGPGVVEALAAGRWTVSPAGDRMGLRLDGAPLPGELTGELASHGVVTGAVQLPPDRSPIVLPPTISRPAGTRSSRS
jgi:allophanate hydrolase subunit 2